MKNRNPVIKLTDFATLGIFRTRWISSDKINLELLLAGDPNYVLLLLIWRSGTTESVLEGQTIGLFQVSV